MLVCTGLGPGNGDHCCYVNGVECVYLRRNTAGRKYACGLFLDLGSWAAVNISNEYRPIGETWESIGQVFNYCETFNPALCCRQEG